jgi:hypothetical protein
MKVTEKLSFADYWGDSRFIKKRADIKSDDPSVCAGDNIYQPISKSEYKQKPSYHSSDDGCECLSTKEHDLNGKFVLISDQFTYFGGDTTKLPANLADLVVTRGHKRFECNQDELDKGRGGMAGKAIRYLERLPRGILGEPRSWENFSWEKSHCQTCQPKNKKISKKKRQKGGCKTIC